MNNKETLQTLEYKRNRKNVNILSIVLLVLSIFLLVRYLLNTLYISALEQGNNDSRIADYMVPNIPQGYIPHYNKGNAAYNKGDYNTAIAEYQQALSLFPSHPDECNIRINLALSIIQKIDFDDLEDEDKRDRVIEDLFIARNILTEENCANESDDSGHNETAEQLKKDIDKILNQYSQSQNQANNNNQQSQPENSSQQNQNMTQHEQQIQQQLQNQMQNALSTQHEAKNEYDSYTGGDAYDFDGKKW